MNVRPVSCAESQRTAVVRGSSRTCYAEHLFELHLVNNRKQWPNCTQHRGDAVVMNMARAGWLIVEQIDWRLADRLTDTRATLLTGENNAYETSLTIHVYLEHNQGQRKICCSMWVRGGPPCTRVGPDICTEYTEYFWLFLKSTCETWRCGQ